jgi:hypothetical protein
MLSDQNNAGQHNLRPIEFRSRHDCFIAPDPLRCDNLALMTIRSSALRGATRDGEGLTLAKPG